MFLGGDNLFEITEEIVVPEIIDIIGTIMHEILT